MFGSGSLLIFNGSSFAGFQDVVVVTINYRYDALLGDKRSITDCKFRTNIFGFSGSPEIPLGEQNSGFLDQRLALQWVQDNIPEFGGDPEKVILFGESARGYSVKQLLALPPTQPSFRATIIQSGGADLPAFPGTSFNHTAQYFGCNGSSSSLECLRQVSATDLKAYISQNGLLFPPVSDHITNIADVGPIITSNNFTDFPIMVGSNANEGRVAATGAGLQSKDNPTTIEVFLNNLFPNNATIRAVVKKAYTKLLNNVYLFASAVITDLGFTCRASSLANLAASNGYSVWRYYYNASFPALYSFPEAGACHSSEMPQVFGTYTVADQYGNVTRAQEKLSGYMQKTWANFANDPYNGLCWSPLGASHEDEMADLGGVDENGGTVVTTSTVDFICSLYGDLISASGH
jgi:carboxylesterase type B